MSGCSGPIDTPMDDLVMKPRAVIEAMIDATIEDCRSNALALLAEGHLKTVLLHRLLSLGLFLREGSHRDADWILGLKDSKLFVFQDKRDRDTAQEGSRDIRIEVPRLHIEVKCFSEFGAKDFFERGENGLGGDLDMIAEGHADVAFLAAHGKLYDDARGVKTDPRGRKPKPESILKELLPEMSLIPTETVGEFTGLRRDVKWTVLARRTKCTRLGNDFGERVVCAFFIPGTL